MKILAFVAMFTLANHSATRDLPLPPLSESVDTLPAEPSLERDPPASLARAPIQGTEDAIPVRSPRESSGDQVGVLRLSVHTALNATLEGLVVLPQNATVLAVFMEAAKLEREDQIVNKALMVIGIGSGVVITLGLAYYAKAGYCTMSGGSPESDRESRS